MTSTHAICNRIRRMTDVANILRGLSTAPTDQAAYDSWLEMKDIIAFLKDSVNHDEFIVYATFRNIFIHALLAPVAALNPPDYEDLLAWDCAPDSAWGVEISFGNPKSIAITPPLSHAGSKTLGKGEQLIFARSFEGRIGQKRYYEVLQKFAQLSEIHFLQERQAYCRLDELGDIEEVIRIIEFPSKGSEYGGITVTCKRRVIGEYAALRDSVIVRTFDFTFCDLSRFHGWAESSNKRERTLEKNLGYDAGNCGERTRHFYGGVNWFGQPPRKNRIINTLGPRAPRGLVSTQHCVAHDWKHGGAYLRKTLCSPEHLGNYFTKWVICPFETNAVFLQREVVFEIQGRLLRSI